MVTNLLKQASYAPTTSETFSCIIMLLQVVGLYNSLETGLLQ